MTTKTRFAKKTFNRKSKCLSDSLSIVQYTSNKRHGNKIYGSMNKLIFFLLYKDSITSLDKNVSKIKLYEQNKTQKSMKLESNNVT